MSRERILSRIHRALEHRPSADLPQPLQPESISQAEAVALFVERITGNGGEVIKLANLGAAKEWLEQFTQTFTGVAVSKLVPQTLHPKLPGMPPEEAPLGISWGLGAVAETGTVLLSSREGRRTQLLPPTHIVFVPQEKVWGNLYDAFAILKEDLPAAIGLHSGPSKSADIGQIIVKGVHGPGRIIAALIEKPGD